MGFYLNKIRLNFMLKLLRKVTVLPKLNFASRKLFNSSSSMATSKPQVIFVLGAPGSGKGTQCTKISEKYDYLHLSAGDLLRKEKANPASDVGQLISNYIKEGKIVPVEITCKLLEDAIFESGKSKVMVDGFPRNQNNLDGWEEQMKGKVDIEFVLFLSCPQDVCTGRILKRSETSGRSDDNLESLKKRFNTYINETMPVVNHYDALGKVRTINATEDPVVVFENIQKLFA